MGKSMEDNLWHRGKRPLVDEYLKNQKQVERVVAGRGFLARPGYLGQAITDVERGLKFQLSDLNYNITKEAVERELAQTGHDYDIAYKEARVAWELEKTQTLTELDQEFADLKQQRQLKEDELANMRIETDLRALVILAAKTTLQEQMEELRQEDIGLRREALPYETQLAQEKLATAQAKLDVIPYVEDIIEAQQNLLAANEANADRKEALISKKEDLVGKRQDLVASKEEIAGKMADLISDREGLLTQKQEIVSAMRDLIVAKRTNARLLDQKAGAMDGQVDALLSLAQARQGLIPKYDEKVTAWQAYLSQLENYISVREQIADVKEQLAELDETRADIKQELVQDELNKIAARQLLQEARIALARMRLAGDAAVLDARILDIWDRLTVDQNAIGMELGYKVDLLTAEMDADETVQALKLEAGTESDKISVDSQVETIEETSASQRNEREQISNIAADLDVTQSLVHMLS
jgi:hypothetical protein